MITLTFAGDESGDVSFAFDKGASRYFVVAMIATPNPDGLRQLLADVRRESGLAASYEFRFHKLSSAPLRRRLLAALGEADFGSWVLIADKTILPNVYRAMPTINFYLYFLAELIRIVPSAQREGATLILDEFGPGKGILSELSRTLKRQQVQRQFKRIVIARSRSESLIQVADLVAGSVLRRDSKNDSEAYRLIERRICRVVEWKGE
jgi:hypothetical protein